MASDIDQLHIYRSIIPATLAAMTRTTDAAYLDHLDQLRVTLSEAVVYDCRAIPIGFLEDTGDAYIAELTATREVLTLPDTYCYFEFPDNVCACAASGDEAGTVEVDENDNEVQTFRSIDGWCTIYYGWMVSDDGVVADMSQSSLGCFTN